MEEFSILAFKLNDVVKMDNALWRIVDITENTLLLINMELNRFEFSRIAIEYFYRMQAEGLVSKVEYQERREPIELLSIDETELLNSRECSIRNMLGSVYPNLEDIASKKKKPYLDILKKEVSLSTKNTLKLVRRYLQSGQDRYSLLDGRHGSANRNKEASDRKNVRGPKQKNGKSSLVVNDEVLETRFEEAFQYFLNGATKGITVAKAYDQLLRTYYCERRSDAGVINIKVKPKEERPSYRRFLLYCQKRLGSKKIRQVKKGDWAVWNDERLLLGNSQSGCDYPGQILEIDEVELDIINVSASDNRQIVGRPIMYLAVDVFSCAIVACWVDFDNNSYVGLLNLLTTLLEEHNVQTEPYGISIPENVYPSCFLPSKIRVDQGSEYVSEDLRRAARELGFSVNLVPPGTGSMKGLVEQTFHQFQEMLRGVGAEAGVILKRHDSDHYAKAVIDIHDARAIAYRYINYHNLHSRPGYPFTREMIESGLEPTPAAIWNYGISHFQKPVQITEANRDRVFFALLKQDRKFTVSRAGIRYKGLFYYKDCSWLHDRMSQVGRKAVLMPGVRYDPRSVNNVYIMMDGHVEQLPLNEIREEQGSFAGMTWKAYDELVKSRQEIHDRYEDRDISLRLETQEQMENVIEQAKRVQKQGKNVRKRIRESRKNDREILKREDAVLREPFNPEFPKIVEEEPVLNICSDGSEKAVIETNRYKDDISSLSSFFKEEE